MNFLSKKLHCLVFCNTSSIYSFIVIGIPSILSLVLCLTDWSGLGKINYVGFENFIELFDDRYFKKLFFIIFYGQLFLTVPVL